LVRARASELGLPLLVLAGAGDPLLDLAALTRFVASLRSGAIARSSRLVVLPGLRHELWLSVPDGAAARQLVVDWLLERVALRGAA
jgi:alpha-beta hydrolase superfamily lysophospholipase